MMNLKKTTHFFSQFALIIVIVVTSACVADPSASKKRGIVKDFSVAEPVGCGTKYLKFISPYDTCTTACSSATATEGGYHLATSAELQTIKTTLTSQSNTSLLAAVTGSANLCIPDVVVVTRPTDAIEISSDFCSCLNGKSDIINNCDSFCAQRVVTDQPILYVNTVPGVAVANNTKLKNLHNWCTLQLEDDDTTPQCVLNATDGVTTYNLSVTTTPGSNSFTANIQALVKNRTWLLKLVESKTGSNAQTKIFQVNRKEPIDDTGVTGPLNVAPVSQYTCFLYGFSKTTVAGTEVISRDNYARRFYYFTAEEIPTPMPPLVGANPATTVCHDENLNPGNDNFLYNRLELIPGAISIWNKTDSRFVAKAENGGKLTINKIIETRLANEYQISSTMDLFKPFTSFTTPSASSGLFLGYIMVPFKNSTTGKTYCPTATEYNGTEPLLNILGDYMDDTEGLYITEKEAEVITQGAETKTIYGTMLARETTLKNYGFYVENGLKIRVNAATMHSKTVHFYWPTSTTADALIQGTRRLFTVKTYANLNGGSSTTQPTSEATTDKRLGCIPKTSN